MIPRMVQKSLTWRMWATAITGTISYFVTGSFFLAGTIVAVDTVIKLLLYVLHEYLWDKV